MNPSETHLEPLGALAPRARDVPWSAQGLDRSHELPIDLRAKVVAYLEACPIFIAWMGYTRDEIGGRFEVPGGSAIASDGKYYWRLDAVAYIREYGIPVPEDAIRHFQEEGWTAPSIDKRDFMRIYYELDAVAGGDGVG